jgi:Protein of unknown function (DUF2971)
MQEPGEVPAGDQPGGPESPSPAAGQSTPSIFEFLQRLEIRHDGLRSGGLDLAHHYTSLQGLCGIIGKDDLWLTNAQYLNDEAEIKAGYDTARAVVIEERAKSAASEGSLYLKHLEEALLVTTRSQCYVCSFCEYGETLSQWRGYAADGAGVDLVIDTRGFVDLHTKCSYGLLYFWQVFYDDAKKERRIRDIIDNFRPEQPENPVDAEERARKASECIEFFIPAFKHISFSGESEWRLIFKPSEERCPEPQFRISRNLLVPYYRLWEDLIIVPPEQSTKPRIEIDGVWVGPSRNQDLVVKSVEMLLGKHKRPQNVRASESTYRGF